MNRASWKKWSRVIMRTIKAELPKGACPTAREIRSIFKETRYAAFLATCGKQFVGFSIGFFRTFEGEDEIARIGYTDIFHLCLCVIHHAFQGRGIGRKLLKARIDYAKCHGAKNCTSFARNGASLSNLIKAGGSVIAAENNFLNSGETFYTIHIDLTQTPK